MVKSSMNNSKLIIAIVGVLIAVIRCVVSCLGQSKWKS